MLTDSELDDQVPLLTIGDSVTRTFYDAATRLANVGEVRLARNADSYCCGKRHFGRPMMALSAKKSLGPVRHALSQMVVAGTMVINPPVQVRITSDTAEEGAEQSTLPSSSS